MRAPLCAKNDSIGDGIEPAQTPMNSDTPDCCILALADEFLPRAEALAAQLALPLCAPGDAASGLQLEVGEVLSLRTLAEAKPGKRARKSATAAPLCIDFASGRAAHRRQFGGGRGQPLARALGLKGGLSPRIIDATAGLGRDAFVLATLGCEVTLIERNPLLAALLEDGLRRGREHPDSAEICARMTLVCADAAEYLRDLSAPQPGCIYMDPMYPHRDKSAAVKKDMRTLQQLVGPDMDSAELLAAALACTPARVVVKRPRGAPVVDGPAPSAAVESPNTRYDLYVSRALTEDDA